MGTHAESSVEPSLKFGLSFLINLRCSSEIQQRTYSSAIIKSWKRNNVGGKLTVNIEYILRSTKTGQTLYRREGSIKVDTSISGGNGALGALVSLIATTVNTATTDKVIAGRKCNLFVLSDLPAGKYSPMYEKDKKIPQVRSS